MRTSPEEEGLPEAKLCFLAEAPARVEVRLGRPLVGPSGDVFNDCLRVTGIARNSVYILNIWPYQVAKDGKDDIYSGSGALLWHHLKGFTAYGLNEAADCIGKLNACQANIVVTLGRPAFSLLSGKMQPIMKWRGSLLWSDAFGRKFLPTIHPAATLHGTYTWRYLIQNDFAKARSEMAAAELRLPERELQIMPSLDDVLDYMLLCWAKRRFATDIEVMNRQVSCFSLAASPQSALTIPLVSAEGTHYWSEKDELSIWREYASLMGDPNITKINQNIVGFDVPFLFMQNHIRTRGPLGDPMIAHHIMYPHFPKGLDFIASYHTREPYWKDEGKIWTAKGAKEVPWDQFQRYCAKDSAVALEAWEILADEMSAGGYWDTYNMTVEMQDILTYMSTRGLAVDTSGIHSTNARTTSQIAEKMGQLAELARRPVNPNSPKDCSQFFYEELGLRPYIGPHGGITTDDKAMARIVRRASTGSKEAKLIQEIRALKKLKGTYLETELDRDGRLRCSWNPRGTWTGRLSSSKTIFGTGMDLQNLHPAYKEFIVSDQE